MKTVLCFGDSNTWGLIAGTQKRYPWGVRWTSLLQDKLNVDEFRVVEEGLCGRTTVFEERARAGRAASAALPFILETHAPISLVVLMLGTNDCKTEYHASVEQICGGVDCLLHQIRDAAGDCKILLVSPIALGNEVWKPEYDPDFDEQSVEKSKKLKYALKALAEKRKVAYLAASDYAAPSRADQEHLDESGHRSLADAIYRQVQKMLAESSEGAA